VWSEVDPIPVPRPDDAPKEYSEKIRKIVDDIANLTLKETADLNELLKKTLNISDIPAMMPAMAVQSGQQQEAEEKKEEKTEFTVKLTRYADDSKIKVIKEVKNLVEGLNLVQAKKLVEGVPQVIKKDVNKEEAEKLRSALEAAGGVVELE
jgi:large subunit ribosomal protein L7/L12